MTDTPIAESVREISTNRWRIGRAVECELLDGLLLPPQDNNIITTWKDGSDSFVLRKTANVVNAKPAVPNNTDYSSDKKVVQLVHALGSSSAVWAVGKEVFCKVKTWYPGMESEARTISFVRENFPQIPVPEVIHEWIDGDRSFLLLGRIEGLPLRDAWAHLSPTGHDNILKTVVEFCTIMAAKTAPCLQGVTGKPVLEPYLSPSRETGLLGPLTREQSISYFFATPTELAPKVDEEGAFHFYHPDLGPGNIMVSGGVVTGILDWELAGFYPGFWIATKPSVSPGLNFCPSVPGFDDHEWRRRLRIALEEKGFVRVADWYMSWRTLRYDKY